MKILKYIYSYVLTNMFHIRLKPRVLQFPITGRCNSRCTTCNVWAEKDKSEVNIEELTKRIQSEYFNKVESVGINGGEPFLHTNIAGVISVLLLLDKIKSIYIISNGLLTDRTLENLEVIKKLCEDKNVKIYLTISIDGIDEIHDKVRGIKGAFGKSFNTINRINENRTKYCDTLTVGYTISNNNIFDMVESQVFFNKNKLASNFHLAVPNKRIGTFSSADYSVLKNPRSKMLATEFFYSRFKYEKSFRNKMVYFLNYYYLKNDGKIRVSNCEYLLRDITIDQNLDLYLCATASNKIGSLKDNSLDYYVKNKCLDKEKNNIKKLCSQCGHYISKPTVRGFIEFIKEKYSPYIWVVYKIRCKLNLI